MILKIKKIILDVELYLLTHKSLFFILQVFLPIVLYILLFIFINSDISYAEASNKDEEDNKMVETKNASEASKAVKDNENKNLLDTDDIVVILVIIIFTLIFYKVGMYYLTAGGADSKILELDNEMNEGPNLDSNEESLLIKTESQISGEFDQQYNQNSSNVIEESKVSNVIEDNISSNVIEEIIVSNVIEDNISSNVIEDSVNSDMQFLTQIFESSNEELSEFLTQISIGNPDYYNYIIISSAAQGVSPLDVLRQESYIALLNIQSNNK